MPYGYVSNAVCRMNASRAEDVSAYADAPLTCTASIRTIHVRKFTVPTSFSLVEWAIDGHIALQIMWMNDLKLRKNYDRRYYEVRKGG